MYNRTRTRGSYPIANPGIASYRSFNGSVNNIPLTLFSSGDTQVTSDVISSAFKRRSNAGEVINNPFSSTVEVRSGSNGSRTGTYISPTPPSPTTVTSITRTGNNGHWGISTVPVLDVTPLIQLASTRALSSIEKPSVEGLPIVAELRQTIKMLRNPIAGIEKALRLSAREVLRIKSTPVSSVRTKRKVAKQLADQHLAFMFGIKPFISDMRSVIKTISELEETPKPLRKTARGFASATVTPTVANTTYNDGEVSGVVTHTSTRTVKVRAGSLYQVNLDLGLSGKFGLTAFDIPSALWELTPWSFVVDWVSNVGDLIAALTPRADITRLAEWYAIEDTTTNTSTLVSIASLNAGYSYSGGGDKRGYTRVQRTRVPVNLGNTIGLVWDPQFDFRRVSLSLSLLTQKLSAFK